MTCDEYQDWSAADVDGERSPEAARAREHAATCPTCAAEQRRQLAARALLRSRSVLPGAPLGLRTRILAAIDEETAPARRSAWSWWIGLAGAALAAALVLVVGRHGEPDFRPLIRGYDLAAAGRLDLDVRTDAPAALEQFYARHAAEHVPPHVTDLSSAGFRLVGGAMIDFPKRRARLSVYSDGRDWVVCDRLYAAGFPLDLPGDGSPVFFEREGMTFCARRIGNEICILATRMGLAAFRRRLGGETAVG